MVEFFSENRTLVVFLHVISAVVWVGGMIAMRFAAHPSFIQLQNPAHRLERIADALGRLFAIVTPFIVILLATALVMAIGLGLHKGDMKTLAFAKEGIWTVMAINFVLMMLRRNAAQKALDANDVVLAKEKLELIGKFMVPANIILGIIAIILGVVFSGTF